MTTPVPHRYRPGRFPTEDIYHRMSRLMQDFFGDGTAHATAPIDVEETDNAYIVDIDMPGVRREDIEIELRDNNLWVCGEIKERERAGLIRRRERRVGQFENMVTLPGDVDPNRVEADLVAGVLTIRVGKARTTQPRRIEVRGS